MGKVAKVSLAAVVIFLAVYGGLKLVSGFLTETHGRAVVETTHPFMRGMATRAAEEVKTSLDAMTPEEREKLAYDWSKSLYPILKGAFLGQVDAHLADPKRDEIAQKMRVAGKAFSENIVGPFSEGVSEGSRKTIGEIEKALDRFKSFSDKHKDVIDNIGSGLGALRQFLKDGPTPVPGQGSPGMPFPLQPPAVPRLPPDPTSRP